MGFFERGAELIEQRARRFDEEQALARRFHSAFPPIETAHTRDNANASRKPPFDQQAGQPFGFLFAGARAKNHNLVSHVSKKAEKLCQAMLPLSSRQEAG
jgi:hypothetical protein